MTETDPNDSTECSFFTIAFRFAILNTPRANVTVVTMGNPSGIAATANETKNAKEIVSKFLVKVIRNSETHRQ